MMKKKISKNQGLYTSNGSAENIEALRGTAKCKESQASRGPKEVFKGDA